MTKKVVLAVVLVVVLVVLFGKAVFASSLTADTLGLNKRLDLLTETRIPTLERLDASIPDLGINKSKLASGGDPAIKLCALEELSKKLDGTCSLLTEIN
jgi:hypothetical protein